MSEDQQEEKKSRRTTLLWHAVVEGKLVSTFTKNELKKQLKDSSFEDVVLIRGKIVPTRTAVTF